MAGSRAASFLIFLLCAGFSSGLRDEAELKLAATESGGVIKDVDSSEAAAAKLLSVKDSGGETVQAVVDRMSVEIEANQSAPFSAEMLKKAQALIQKHTPEAVSEILTEDKLTSLLEHHGEVRAALSSIDPEFTLREHKAMKHLYKRAIGALDTSTVALLEESTRGKTPCVLMLEEYRGTELVDLDKIGDLGTKHSCNRRCISGCKRKSKFNINRDELRILGQDPDAPGLDGNQIGGQCERDGDCKCLDATQSCNRIRQVQQRLGRFDVSSVYHTYDDESDCMSSCPVRINQGGAEWRGMCFDEAPHSFYDDDNYGW